MEGKGLMLRRFNVITNNVTL